MRKKLSADRIKQIADRAEGREPEFVLREFVCKHCGHKVVVNPNLPPDVTPTVCTPCYEKFDKPKRGEALIKLMVGLCRVRFFLGDKDAYRDAEAIYGSATVKRMIAQLERECGDHEGGK